MKWYDEKIPEWEQHNNECRFCSENASVKMGI